MGEAGWGVGGCRERCRGRKGWQAGRGVGRGAKARGAEKGWKDGMWKA